MWVWVGINYLLCLWLSVSTKFYRLVLCNPPALLLALFFGLITSSMTIGVWPLMLKWSPIIEPRQPQNQQPPDSLMARSPRHRYKFNRYRKGPLKEDVFLEMQTIWYSCNNITTTLIQISRLFYFGFFSKTNHQMII